MQNELPQKPLWPDLMRRAQAGDQEAYRQLLKALLPVIRAFARRQIRDAELLEDVVQDSLLSIHRLRHTYDPSRPLLPWLAAITSARAVDAWRQWERTGGRAPASDEALAWILDDGAARRQEAYDSQRELQGLLASLPERQRRIVEMVKLQEMSLHEAASASRLSLASVKSLLHRALRKLRSSQGRHP